MIEIFSSSWLPSPFSCIVLESYPSRTWYIILDLKQNIEKLLNDTKQYQLYKTMIQLSFSLESWYFICTNLVNSGASFFHFTMKKHWEKDALWLNPIQF